mgnify:CR=1 FL=1
MKRQVQYAGVKKWAGSDIVECQSQPLEAIDRFFGQYGPHILQGCEVTLSGDRAEISAGLVALEGKDVEGNNVRMVVPFEGVTGTVLPVYLTLSHTVRERPYVDGSVKPVAYDYKAVAAAVKPAESTPYLEITAAGGRRFSDVVQDAGHRFITDAERTKWNEAQSAAENHADSVAAEAEETSVRDAVLRTRLTGTKLDKGYFKTADESLLFTGDRTMRVVFVTGDDVTTRQAVFRDGYNNQHNTISVASGWITGRVGGTSYQTAAQPDTIYEVVLVKTADGCKVSVNGVVQNKALAGDAAETRFIEVGNSEKVNFFGRIISVRVFNFAFSDTDIAASWNDGHPELWRVPDIWRNIVHSQWPSYGFTASAGTWVQNNNATKITSDVSAANGFSGTFLRAINDTPGNLSVYNSWRISTPVELKFAQLVEFEYRSDGAIKAIHGSTVLATFPANTGNAVTVSYIAPAGQYTSLSMASEAGTYIEIRTLRIMTLGCLLDLTPAGLTPTIWYDVSGQENDVPYFLNGNKAGEVELSYDTTGFPVTTADDRVAVLAYAARYDADREEVFVRRADANAGQALADHAADAVKHVTASERSAWNAKADLDETGHVAPQQIAPQQGRQQGVRTEYGYYKSAAASLNPEGSQTHVVTFVTGDDVTTSQTVAAGKNFAVTIVAGMLNAASVSPNRLYQVVYVVDSETGKMSLYLNGTLITSGNTSTASDALHIGRYSDSTPRPFKGTVISYRQFSFAMRAEDIAEVWNGGRPVAWRVPADYRKELPSSWPTSVYTASASTWRENHNYITYTPNVAAINGFSGAFERFTASATAEDLSTYNSFRQNYAPDRACWQYVKFEYRCDKDFEFRSGGTVVASFAANTGDAQIGYVIFPPKTYGGFFVEKGATYLEIRTLEITTLGLCTAAFEPESLLPEGWRNMIDGGTNLEYTPYEEDSVAFFDYTVPEEPGAVSLAKQYTDEREEQIRSDFDAADKTILAQAKAYSDSVADSKQDTIPTITIADFDTFNPSGVASMSSMPVGAGCYFISNGAVGRPATITDSKVWCGRITKMSATQYRIEAFNTSGNISTPQFATRLYTNTKVYDWQLLTEDMRNGTSGYAKFPGGLMLEWGKVAAADINVQPVTVKFPMTFPGGIPFSIACIAWDGDNQLDMRTFTVTSLSASQMQVRITDMSGGSVGANGCTFLWQAIGKW